MIIIYDIYYNDIASRVEGCIKFTVHWLNRNEMFLNSLQLTKEVYIYIQVQLDFNIEDI